MSTLSYCGHPVEIDDFSVSFRKLRVEIYSYVSRCFPELGELTPDNYKMKWNSAVGQAVDITAKCFEENNIPDYSTNRIITELQEKCYGQFETICGRIDKSVAEYQQQASQNSGNTSQSITDSGAGTERKSAMGIAKLSANSYGRSGNISDVLKRESGNIRAAFKAMKENVSVYITRVVASKMLDANYLNQMDAGTEALFTEIKEYSGKGRDDFDALIARLLNVNSIDWYVYERIFNANKKDYRINPFEIEKIAEVHKIDISELIIDYFMNVSDRLGGKRDKKLLDNIIKETAAYKPEESGVYTEFIADINGYMQDYRRILTYLEESEDTTDFDKHMEIGKRIQENRIMLRQPIAADTPLNQRFCESLDEINEVLSGMQYGIAVNFYTYIFGLATEDSENMTIERAVYIADIIGSHQDKNDEQAQIYAEFCGSISNRAEQMWTEQLKNEDHDGLAALRDAYNNGTEPFYNLVQQYFAKETYEKHLEITINDLENKTMFRKTLGLMEKTPEELKALREELIAMNYGETITNNFVNKINQVLYEKLHDKLMQEITEKISGMDYNTVNQEYNGGNNSTFSFYQPDEYVSTEDIQAVLLEKIDNYENKFLEEMCTGVEDAELTDAQDYHDKVQSSPYREENKGKYLLRIRQRIIYCQEEVLRQICVGRENLVLSELLSMAEKLHNTPYDHLDLKAELAEQVNACIRKAKYASFMQEAAALDGIGFKTITDNGIPVSDFEKTSMADMGIFRDSSLVQQNYGDKMLGSQEVIIGIRKSERMFGLANDLKILITEKHIMISDSSLIAYSDITSLRVVKKLLATKIEIGTAQGSLISFGCSKDEAPKLCEALQQVVSSLV